MALRMANERRHHAVLRLYVDLLFDHEKTLFSHHVPHRGRRMLIQICRIGGLG